MRAERIWEAARDGHSTALMECLHGATAEDYSFEKQDGGTNYTALGIAAERGHADIINLLIKAGAGVNHHEAKWGYTALIWAAYEGRIAAVRALLEAGADINLQNKGGYTALMWAAEQGHTSVVEVLLEAGADINTTDHHGYTALMRASMWGKADVARVLLEAGAYRSPQDQDGQSAEDLSKTEELRRLIASYGHTHEGKASGAQAHSHVGAHATAAETAARPKSKGTFSFLS